MSKKLGGGGKKAGGSKIWHVRAVKRYGVE